MNVASTARLHQSLQVDRYAAAACGLMLMLLLTVGAIGYAGIRATFPPVAAVVAQAGAVDSDNFPAPTAPLVLIGALLFAAVAAPRRSRAARTLVVANIRTTI